MNHSRKDITMMIFIGVLLAFATYNFLIRPQGNKLSAARADLSSIEHNVSAAQLALRTPTDTTATGTDAGAAPPAVPEDPAISQLLRQLNDAAAQTGVALASITPAPLGENPNGPGGSVQISITASGSHEAVAAYLAALRDMDRLLVVEQIADTVQAAVPDQTQQLDQLQLSVRVFTLRQPPKAAPTVGTTTPKP